MISDGLDVGGDALLLVAEDRIDAVGARLAVGAGAHEAVLERAAAHVHVDARVEHDVHAGVPAGLLDRGEEGGLLARVAQDAGGVVGVLEVAAHGAGAEQARDEGIGLQAVAGLAVGGDRDVDGGDDARERSEGLLGGKVAAVLVAERLRQPHAGGGQRGGVGDERPGAGRVPGVAQHERGAGAMQRAQGFGARREVCGHDGHGVSFAATPSRVQALMVMLRKTSAASSASEKCSAAAS